MRKSFFESRDTPSIAKNLLGKFLVRRLDGYDKACMITEVEAYDGPHDKASHAHRGKTGRNTPMFGDAGGWYVYFTYGAHWMLNIVTGPKNYPAAILIRGISEINGPGRLTKRLVIDKKFNNKIASQKTDLWIEDRNILVRPSSIQRSARIGVAYADEWALKPYRFYIKSLVLSRHDAETLLKTSCVGIIPTDTIYGVVGRALDKQCVERIYNLRRRDTNKPMIILIASLDDLKLFGIKISSKVAETLQSIWPGKVSVILPCNNKKFGYLHRGTKTLAFRVPSDAHLRKILKEVGPLVAPSANLEGKKPATTILEAKKYFGDRVDFYVDGGKIKSLPSTLIAINDKGSVEVKRQGTTHMDEI